MITSGEQIKNVCRYGFSIFSVFDNGSAIVVDTSDEEGRSGVIENENDADLISASPNMAKALISAKQFINNGIEYGYINLPETGDSALEIIDIINKALIKAKCL